MQSKVLLRITSAYKTASTKVLQVIAGVIPIHSMVIERKRLFDRRDGNTVQVKQKERWHTVREWQNDWDDKSTVAP